MNIHGHCARAFQLCRPRFFPVRIFQSLRCDGDRDLAAQLHPLVLVVDHRAGGLARDVLPFKGNRRRGFSNLGVLVVQNRVGLYSQFVARLDIHVAVELNQALLLVVERAVGGDLIVLIFRGREDLKIYLLEFMMAIGVSNIARRTQPQVELIVLRNPLLVPINNSGDFG